MIISIDARQLATKAGLHGALANAFGFPGSYGKNMDALVDCLGDLDDPSMEMTRVHVLPGQTAVIRLTHLDDCEDQLEQIRPQLALLNDAAAFVNQRRLDEKKPPLLALAYSPA